ncbi:MAG TPA: sigma-70 family RNA polymerase sigma factor [Bryobacteraceae bacterium]|nr:sigma-70 family RNA polymerase sigma factor [Bryobacteraceae bacterium]
MLLAIEQRSSEVALIRAAQDGDRAAFGELYRQYERLVHGILLAQVSYHDAEDLMHDVFVKALEQLSALREPAAFPGWLITIARRLAADHQRGAQSRRLFHWLARPAKYSNAEPLAILRTLQQLPETYRETLILRLVEGMTGPEIAARTGLTPESVRVNLCRGMKILREGLKQR